MGKMCIRDSLHGVCRIRRIQRLLRDICAARLQDVYKRQAPGFIDSHSHNDWFACRPDPLPYFAPFLEQGVATQVAGNCGFSPFGWEAGTPHRALIGSGLFSLPQGDVYKRQTCKCSSEHLLNCENSN